VYWVSEDRDVREQYLATGKDVLQYYETADIKPTC
jgi:hypothetical protein